VQSYSQVKATNEKKLEMQARTRLYNLAI